MGNGIYGVANFLRHFAGDGQRERANGAPGGARHDPSTGAGRPRSPTGRAGASGRTGAVPSRTGVNRTLCVSKWYDPGRNRSPEFTGELAVGEAPKAGHWAARCPGFMASRAGLGRALDELAVTAGAADGLVLIQKLFGVTAEDIEAAGCGQARDWFYRAYARYGGEAPGGGGDVVAHGCGIWAPGTGWDYGSRGILVASG